MFTCKTCCQRLVDDAKKKSRGRVLKSNPLQVECPYCREMSNVPSTTQSLATVC